MLKRIPETALPDGRETAARPERLPPDLAFDEPADYVIVVQGVVAPDWSCRLAGLAISTTERDGTAPHTTLRGPLCDQAQLSGVLATLHGLHLPILRVETVEEPPAGDVGRAEERR